MEQITLIGKYGALIALPIGLLFLGKRYYNYSIYKTIINITGNRQDRLNYFIIERIIDAECKGKNLYIGIQNKSRPDNILSNQGIRWGEGKENQDIKSLVSFVKGIDSLVYEFEDNTHLTLYKDRTKDKVIFTFKSGDEVIVKEMNKKLVEMFKPIGLSSSEIDKIAELK